MLIKEEERVKNRITDTEKSYAMAIHLVALFTGVFGPLLMWLFKKDESTFIHRHGRNALNFQLSLMIYYGISLVLTFVFLGIIGFFVLPFLTTIFCIIAAIKAYNGEAFKYPMTIKFIS